MFDVVVIGSLNLDLVGRVGRLPSPGETVLGHEYQEFPGGKGLNQAVAAARAGASVAMVGCVGDDDAGRALRRVLDDERVDHSAVTTMPVATGRALILVDDRGENSIAVVPGANRRVSPPTALPAARVVLAQLEVPIDAVTRSFELAREQRATTILNPAPADALPASLLAHVDVVTPNEHEHRVLGAATESVATVVVTRGPDGLEVWRDGVAEDHPAFRVDPIDTTGAGDAFNGALAARLAAGDDVEAALRVAAAAGALTVTRPGAVPSIPTSADVERLLAETAS